MSYKRSAKSKLRDRSNSLTDIRLQPAILRRKRKAENDFEVPISPVSENGDIQSQSDPCLSEESHSSTTEIISSPHSSTVPFSSPSSMSSYENANSLHICRFRVPSSFPTPEVPMRNSPLPKFSWAQPGDVWRIMVEKDAAYLRNHDSMSRHPNLHAKMRSILLDWLMEVCEVYTLHRATFYLAQDFVDRYLATQTDIPKQQLQLLGITCLFIASKIEEIYPPKLAEFAFVTDGACSENEIIDKELAVLKVLNWDLCPITVNTWLNIYLQLASIPIKTGETQDNFIFPDYPPDKFIQAHEILDLSFLDINCLQFSYGVLAASALVHVTSTQCALAVSGYKWAEISKCVKWLAGFYETVKEKGFACLAEFKNVSQSEAHYIQTHSIDLDLLEKAQSREVDFKAPVIINQSTPCHLGTTPKSTKKLRKSPHEIITQGVIHLD